ncbi:MAG: ATP-binding protein [Byssovorax sp.]
MTTPAVPTPLFSRRDWMRMWLQAAAVGTLLLVLYFAGYELLEQLWMKDRLSIERIFSLHRYRGLFASVLIGTTSIYVIWRSRRTYDQAFVQAYLEVEEAMKQRTRALEQNQAFTERLFDALRDRLIVLDQAGVIVKANRVALDAACARPPVGHTCAMLGGACSPSAEGCVAARAQRTRLPIIGQQIRTDPRSGRIYAIDAYPMPDLDGKGPLVIESARDITDEKQLEARLLYQEKLAALGVLAAGIAHDIVNPLASMSSELEMIEGETDPTRVRESIAVLRGQVSRIDRSLREMTDFARRRGDEVTLVPIAVAVDDALRMVRHDPRARKVTFGVDVAEGLPPLRLVEDHLVMVIVNLVINAFDAMPEGGSLSIRGRRDAGGVTLSIADSGTGMSDEVRKRAIEPLFTTKPAGKGTGLGLSVSADIVRDAGGTLTIESSPGHGTTVALHFGAACFDGVEVPSA